MVMYLQDIYNQVLNHSGTVCFNNTIDNGETGEVNLLSLLFHSTKVTRIEQYSTKHYQRVHISKEHNYLHNNGMSKLWQHVGNGSQK